MNSFHHPTPSTSSTTSATKSILQPSAQVVLLGLSGPSSAGKTTFAHLLSHIFPPITLILHGDDFCKEIASLPIVDGVPDADAPDSVDFIRMAQVLDYVKANAGKTPPDFKSWQSDVFPGQKELALRLVRPSLITELRQKVQTSGIDFDVENEKLRIVLVEGMMLYNIPEIRKRLDIRLFLRISHDLAKSRRMSRLGYGSDDAQPGELEFWKTEEYFEKMVWRNYKSEHAAFFQDGDVEGVPDMRTCADAGVVIQPAIDAAAKETLRWMTDAVIGSLKGQSQTLLSVH